MRNLQVVGEVFQINGMSSWTLDASIWERGHHNMFRSWSISIGPTTEEKDADKTSWKRRSRDIGKCQSHSMAYIIEIKVMGRWQRNALRVDTWRLILKRCRYAFWSSKETERENDCDFAATECRRGFDGILYGEYMLYCVVGSCVSRDLQCVSCKHGWRVNNWCYTYTPTEQKSATTPKPPRILAIDATAVSHMGTVCFGMLNGMWEWLFGINGSTHVEK